MRWSKKTVETCFLSYNKPQCSFCDLVICLTVPHYFVALMCTMASDQTFKHNHRHNKPHHSNISTRYNPVHLSTLLVPTKMTQHTLVSLHQTHYCLTCHSLVLPVFLVVCTSPCCWHHNQLCIQYVLVGLLHPGHLVTLMDLHAHHGSCNNHNQVLHQQAETYSGCTSVVCGLNMCLIPVVVFVCTMASDQTFKHNHGHSWL